MERSKTGKYIKYALGEIVLVVIGILIAIQLNDWRNDNSNNLQKQNVLKSLRSEFQSNISQLDTVLNYVEKIKKAYPMVMGFLKTQDVIKENSEFYEPLNSLSYQWTFNPINGALRSGISSGEIHLINNDRLIELLFGWEDLVKDSEEEGQRVRDYQLNSISLLQKYIRVSDIYVNDYVGAILSDKPSDFKGLFKDVLFEDYVHLSFIWATEYESELNVIRIKNMEILELIDMELLN